MLGFDFERLSALGLNSALAGRAAALEVEDDAPLRLARVIEVHRETAVVDDGWRQCSARPLPRLVRALGDDGTALAVGDWVAARSEANDQCWLVQRVPPASAIARRDGDGRVHAVVSNVDVALLVMGLDADFNPRRLERFLAVVHGEAIVPVVVLTKADLCAPAHVERQLASLRDRLPAHVEVVAVNAMSPSAAQALHAWCTRGQTLVLLGSSGAGKSTLTNTLIGRSVQDTGPVRDNDGRGKHTTTARSLHRLAGGACIIDTPGLRALRPGGDETAVTGSFPDVEALAGACRFADCTHGQEPGCAVREGVDADRLRNYHKLLREMRRDALTALDRQRQLAQWKVRGRAVKARMRMKRGLAG